MAEEGAEKPRYQRETPKFLQKVGTAVLSWQEVESSLAMVFGVLVSDPSNIGPAFASHLAIVSFTQKLADMDAAAAVALKGDDRLEQWRNLSAKLSSASSHRNAIAHGT